jgi:hypothetical protein
MNMNWKITTTAFLLSAALVASTPGVKVFAQQSTVVNGQADVLKLTNDVQVKLKRTFSERTVDNTTIGAVIVLSNSSNKVTRVPDYELRVTTGDGVSYTLSPSLTNARSIQPKGKVELSYLLQVDRTDSFVLKKLNWVYVNEYVYPRKMTSLLSMNITGKVWQGNPKEGEASASEILWGKSFKLDAYSPDISYTPISLQRQGTDNGDITVVVVRAVNSGKEQAFVPDFVISGTDGQKLYDGVRASDKATVLGAGEAKNLFFGIPTRAAISLNRLVVMTPERFTSMDASGGANQAVFYVGHSFIGMPSNNLASIGLKNYTYGTPIVFDSQNELMDKKVQVSLVELHMHDNQGDGYKTAVAKFKLHNTGKLPVPLPAFQAELANGEGYTYSGDRQNVAVQQLMPGLSHVISYSFNVPKTEDEETFMLRILDGTTVAPYRLPIAAIGTTVQSDSQEDFWNLYPFKVKMNSWSLQAYIDTVPFTSYSYKLLLDFDIERTDDVVVDEGFSKLKIEIADSAGRMLGSETIPFVGLNRLISGKQTIMFDSIRTAQHQYPVTINFYEIIDTPNGEATRLIETVSQK